MLTLAQRLAHGALAGAVGTTALNATTYLDMAVRRRPASTTPEDTVETAADLLGVPLPQDDDERKALESGLGALLGTVAGLATGIGVAVLRTSGHPRRPATTAATAWALAMLAGNGPMTLLGVTDPRTWRRTDWMADVVPHVAYAAAVAVAFDALER